MAIRVGVIGTAYWAADIHAPGWQAAEGVELVGIHGRSPEKTEEAARRNGIKAFTNLDDMLEAVDAVSIAVSPDAQPGYAVKAAEAGKHLLLEKPIALDVAAAEAIVRATGCSGSAALVFFVRRFVPEIAGIIERERGRGWTRAAIRMHAAPLVENSPYRNSVWRHAEGAALWDIGPHALSVLLPMMGAVTAVRRLPADADYIRFATTHAHGGEAEISLTLRAPPDGKETVFTFSGPSGTLDLPDVGYDRTAIFTRAAEQFARMVETRVHAHDCDLRLGLETVRILQSAENDRGQAGA